MPIHLNSINQKRQSTFFEDVDSQVLRFVVY
jgi:hypothetical protein